METTTQITKNDIFPMSQFFPGDTQLKRIYQATKMAIESPEGTTCSVLKPVKGVVGVHTTRKIGDGENRQHTIKVLATAFKVAHWKPTDCGPSDTVLWSKVTPPTADIPDFLSTAFDQQKTQDETKKLIESQSYTERQTDTWKTALRNEHGVTDEHYKNDPQYRQAEKYGDMGAHLRRAMLGDLYERVLCCNYELGQLQLTDDWCGDDTKAEETMGRLQEILELYHIPASLRLVVNFKGTVSLGALVRTSFRTAHDVLTGDQSKASMPDGFTWVYQPSSKNAKNASFASRLGLLENQKE